MCSKSHSCKIICIEYNGGASTNRIEFITISSTGNGIDFGDLARPPLTYLQEHQIKLVDFLVVDIFLLR